MYIRIYIYMRASHSAIIAVSHVYVKGSEEALISRMDNIIMVASLIISRFDCDVTRRDCDFYVMKSDYSPPFLFRHENRKTNIHSRNEWMFSCNEHFVALSGCNIHFNINGIWFSIVIRALNLFGFRGSLLSFAGFNRDFVFGSGDRRVSTGSRHFSDKADRRERDPFDWLEWRTCRNFWVYCSWLGTLPVSSFHHSSERHFLTPVKAFY